MNPFRYHLILALTTLLFGFQRGAEAKGYELIIVAGQSNAQGWKGNAAELVANPKVDSNIPFYYVYPEGKGENAIENKSNDWETLGPQKGRFPAGHFGPEIQLAREVYKAKHHPQSSNIAEAPPACAAPGRAKATAN